MSSLAGSSLSNSAVSNAAVSNAAVANTAVSGSAVSNAAGRERVIALVDRWIAAGLAVYPAKEPPFDPEDGGVPPAMWEREPSADGEVRWKALESSVGEADLARIEARVDAPLPPLVRAYLSTRCIGPLETREVRLPALWSDAPLRDVESALAAWSPLERAGYLAIAEDGDDVGPLCLDLRSRDGDGECPVVCFDHERLLALGTEGCRDRAQVAPLAQRRWDSFAAMLAHVESAVPG